VDQGVEEVLTIALYPQYAMATTETINVKIEELRDQFFPRLKITSFTPFYNKPDYIQVLSRSIKDHLQHLDHEYLLFSYHGVPERHIRKSDITKSHCKIDETCCTTTSEAHQFCYRHQCYETTRLVAQKLNLKEGAYGISFQSRLGFDPWLQPYTDRTIERLGKKGIIKMAIVTPAFVSDCLETLEEIAMEGAEIFHEVGGEEFTTIPCLNDREDFAQLLIDWIEQWRIVDVKTAIA